LPVTVSGWSASSDVGFGDGVPGAVSAELTVTVGDVDEVPVSGAEAPSVTWSSNW